MKKLRNISAFHFFQSFLSLFLLFGLISLPVFATSVLEPDRNSNPNRSPEGATPLRLDYSDDEGNTISFDEGDRTDWYVVKVRQDGELEVILKNKVEGDLDLEAYGPDKTTLLESSITPGTEIKKVRFQVEARRKYYLKVYAHGPGDEGDYILQNIFYKKDTEAPQIDIPRTHWRIIESSLFLSGTVKDNREIKALWLNDKDIFSATDLLNQEAGEVRAFSYTIADLTLGETTLTLQAEDRAGNVSPPLAIRIIRQDPRPEIQIKDIKGTTIRTKEPQVIIRGIVRDNEDITRLLINGEDITDFQTEHSLADVRFLAKNQIEFTYTLTELDYGVYPVKIFVQDNYAQTNETTLTILYDSPPQIEIVSPQKGETDQSEIEIQGYITDDVAISQVFINDDNLVEDRTAERLQQVETAPGEPLKWKFTYHASKLEYGPNTITIVAKDDLDNVTKHDVIVERKEVPPNIVIELPAAGQEFSEETVLVKGYAKDLDGVKELTINATPVPIEPSGAFEYLLPSPPQGSFKITVKATDSRDNEESATVDIMKTDKTPPRIQIITPGDGTQITGPRIAITCIVSDNARMEQITIHGEEKGGTETQGEEKKFDHLITNLKEESNRIEITAIDENGNQSREEITIYSLNPDYRSGDDKELAGAKILELNSRYESTLSYNQGDRTDWYKLRTPTYGELHIFIHNKLAGDLDVQLYSADPDDSLPTKWNALAEASDRGSGNEYLHHKIDGGRWVFVKVFAYQHGDEGDYTIENSFYEIDNKSPRIIVTSKELTTFEPSITINGTIKDEKGIADISVNGKNLAPLPERLPETSEDIRAFSAPVGLQVGENRVKIWAKDTSDNIAEEVIIVTRKNPPPKVTIESPEHETRFRENSLTITGTVQDDEEVKQVMLNDIDITGSLKTSSDSLMTNRGKQRKEFEYQLTLEQYGEHQIVVTAFDNFDDKGQHTITLYRDEPPEIVIESPPEDFHTRADMISIQGKVNNDWEGVEITVNGVALTTVSPPLKRDDGSGVQQNFTQQVALKYGSNPIQIDAKDALENISSKTLTIVREEVDPVITISAPIDQAEIIEDTVLVEGVVIDKDDIAAITIDGEAVKFNASGEFHHQVSRLPYGKREIVIVAKDTRGNETSKSVHIARVDQEKPRITVVNVEDGMKTRKDEIRVEIKVHDNNHLGSIQVNEEVLYGQAEELGAEKSFTYLAKNLLDGLNPVEIIVKDVSGNSASHSIRIHKVPPPAILIEGEISGRLKTEEKIINITGTIQTAAEVASLNIDGEKITVNKQTGNSFTYKTQPLKIRENSLAFIAIDTLGGTTRKELVITRIDNTPPELEIISPKNGARTKENDILVEIQVYDDDRIEEIIINGETLEGFEVPGIVGTRTHMVGLKHGNNPIRVIARDASGNHSSQTHQVYKVPPPEIVVSQPQPPAQTVADTILVKGYIQTSDKIDAVLIGEESITFEPGNTNRFSHRVSLPELGDNSIEILARDSLGGESQETITITRMDPDYQSGRDKNPEGANRLPREGTVSNNLTVNYDEGDRTDWFYITLNTTGDWIIRVTNTDLGALDLELYGSDAKVKLNETQIPGMGSDELEVEVSQVGKYYAKVMAHAMGDRGQYTISNRFYEVDRIRPEITLSSPQGEEVWIDKEQALKIIGTARDNSEMKDIQFEAEPGPIKPLGTSQKLGKTQNFEYDIIGLQPGKNVLRILAIDHADNVEEYKLHILVGKEDLSSSFLKLYSVKPAKILVTDKNENIRKVETRSETLTIEGEVLSVDIQGIQVYIKPARIRGLQMNRSIPVMKTETEFRVETDLFIGENEIIIEAIDNEEHKNQFTLFALRKDDEAEPEPSSQNQDPFQKYLGLRTGDVYAVIIGIGDYQDENINDLRFTENDANKFYEILIDKNYGRVPPENIRLLLNKEATVKNIKAAIGTWLSDNAQEEDTVLIYYAGHGAPQKDRTYWLTHDAKIDDLYSSALSNAEISDMLSLIKSKRLITFLDSCYSAATVKPKGDTRNASVPTKIPFEQFTGEGRITISASDGKQRSLELEEYGHGVFTYYLLKGLKGRADRNGDAVVDVDEIWNYIKDQVTAAAKKASNSQTPAFQGEHTSRIFLTFDVPSFWKKLQDEQFQTRRSKIIELYQAGKLSAEELNKAIDLLETDGEREKRMFNDFFNGKFSLDIFRQVLATFPSSE